jgi:hypothetical protein
MQTIHTASSILLLGGISSESCLYYRIVRSFLSVSDHPRIQIFYQSGNVMTGLLFRKFLVNLFIYFT